MQRDDPEQPNFVILDVNIERKSKIKISEIVINGNQEIREGKLKAAMKKTKEKSLVISLNRLNILRQIMKKIKYNLLDKYNELGYRDASFLSDSVVAGCS